MIVRVFDDNDWATYYCTLCNRPFKALQEANEHGRFCGQAVPTQPVFRSYTTAATFELEDDDIQDYKKPWAGLTDAEIDALWGSWMRPYAQMISDKLREKNT
jgi:hypothetical protein